MYIFFFWKSFIGTIPLKTAHTFFTSFTHIKTATKHKTQHLNVTFKLVKKYMLLKPMKTTMNKSTFLVKTSNL
jgi:hypothetical protein